MEKKHALIITAYQELDFLEELCKIYSKYFNCYVHIDKKCQNYMEGVNRLGKINNVFAASQYKIKWGSYKHILAILYLLQKAVDDGIDFFHVISANTLLIKHPQKLKDFLEQDPSKIYMEVKKNDLSSFYEFEYRYTAYFFQHLYDLKGKRSGLWQRVEYWGAAIQRKLKLRTKVEMDYKGYIYCHLPREIAMYVLDYVKKNRQYIRTLKHCYVGEEFFFQNIIMKSDYALDVVNDVLIYDEWGDRGNPAFLDMTDIDKLSSTDAFFARKISKNQKKVFDILRQQEGF